MAVSDITAGVAAKFEPLLNVKQVGEVLNCSSRTIYRLCDQGKLKPIKVGSLVRFKADEIRAFLNGGNRR